MSSSIVVKIKYGDDLRRITLERTPLFSELNALVAQLFPQLRSREFSVKYQDSDNDMITIGSDFETREAFEVAKQLGTGLFRLFIIEKAEPTPAPSPAPAPAAAAASNPLAALMAMLDGVELHYNNPESGTRVADISALLPALREAFGAKSASPAESSSEEPSVHRHVTCDGCKTSPIVGPRFKCKVCDDFDLCASCESKNMTVGTHNPTHTMIKFTQPKRFGHHGHHAHRRGVHSPAAAAAGPSSDQAEGQRWRRHAGLRGCSTSPFLARFVADVTVNDGTKLAPGTQYNKVWRMRNEGAEWPEQTALIFVGGDKLAATESVFVGPVKEGQEVDVAVEMAAPATPGRYTSYWRLTAPDGQRFGQRVWSDIYVEGQAAPAPVPAPVPVQAAVEVPAPAPALVPVTTLPSAPFVFGLCAPAPVPAPVVVETPLVAPVPPPAPVVPEFVAVPALSNDEEQKMAVLRDMGFGPAPRLVDALRGNQGQLLAAIRDLCNDM
eukprot:TRINITY_DN75_c0_g1_i1.p1 TRINITY_DN75_c0_g1~~TRINITY_DN75_c0_g1_i1.p1  ORF type:complete len:496 (+),score=181.84 TRINITY_DN75_c0_g1_i1:97-1584(+)